MRHSLKMFGLIFMMAGGYASAQIIISTTPLPAPTPIRLKPDLTVSGLTINSSTTIHCGSQTVSITYTESNIGNAPSGTYWNHVYRNGTALVATASSPRPSLGAGATRVVTDTFTYYAGPCDCFPGSNGVTFSLKIDGPNQVAEKNENNNFSNTVTATEVCP